MFAQAVAAVGATGVIASLLLVARQTHELAKQTRLNNSVGVLSEINDALVILHEPQRMIAHKPRLRKSFYDQTPCPRRGTVAQKFASGGDDRGRYRLRPHGGRSHSRRGGIRWVA